MSRPEWGDGTLFEVRMKSMITFEEIKKDPGIRTYIQKADESLINLGFTEHSFAHVGTGGGQLQNIFWRRWTYPPLGGWLVDRRHTSMTSAMWSTGWITPRAGR